MHTVKWLGNQTFSKHGTDTTMRPAHYAALLQLHNAHFQDHQAAFIVEQRAGVRVQLPKSTLYAVLKHKEQWQSFQTL